MKFVEWQVMRLQGSPIVLWWRWILVHQVMFAVVNFPVFWTITCWALVGHRCSGCGKNILSLPFFRWKVVLVDIFVGNLLLTVSFFQILLFSVVKILPSKFMPLLWLMKVWFATFVKTCLKECHGFVPSVLMLNECLEVWELPTFHNLMSYVHEFCVSC